MSVIADTLYATMSLVKKKTYLIINLNSSPNPKWFPHPQSRPIQYGC